MGLVKNWQFFHLSISNNDNVFDDILERVNTFEENKNKKSIKSKNCYFSNGVSPWFW